MGNTSKDLRSRRLKALGQAIATKRSTLGLSQKALGEEVGTSQNAVYEWETGKVAPGADKIWAIADALDCTASEIFLTAEDTDSDNDD